MAKFRAGPMRAIAIDAGNGIAYETSYSGNWRDIPDQHLRCDRFDVVETPYGSLYIDDEGLLQDCGGAGLACFQIGPQCDPLVGNGLLLGSPGSQGEDTPCTASLDDVRSALRFGRIFTNPRAHFEG